MEQNSAIKSLEADPNYKRAALSLYVILGVYALGLAWLGYVSIVVGEVQNPLVLMLWGGLVLWCALAMRRGSQKARKWAMALFTIHLLLAVFYIVFPLLYELTLPLLVIAVASGIGLMCAWRAGRA